MAIICKFLISITFYHKIFKFDLIAKEIDIQSLWGHLAHIPKSNGAGKVKGDGLACLIGLLRASAMLASGVMGKRKHAELFQAINLIL
jgi:hypothetical protein